MISTVEGVAVSVVAAALAWPLQITLNVNEPASCWMVIGKTSPVARGPIVQLKRAITVFRLLVAAFGISSCAVPSPVVLMQRSPVHSPTVELPFGFEQEGWSKKPMFD